MNPQLFLSSCDSVTNALLLTVDLKEPGKPTRGNMEHVILSRRLIQFGEHVDHKALIRKPARAKTDDLCFAPSALGTFLFASNLPKSFSIRMVYEDALRKPLLLPFPPP